MSPYVGYATFFAAVVLYGAATTLFYLEVVRGTSGSEGHRLAPRLLGGGAIAHALYVVIASFVRHECPVHSIHFFMSMAALVATTVYLLARTRFRLHALGLVVAPLGLVTTLGTFFLGTSATYRELPASFIGLHVFVLLVGEALFLLACAAAVMYLVQERRLKDKKSALKRGLPPLESLDRAVHRFLIAGFPLLTMGVATGTVQAKMLEGGSTDDVIRAVLGWGTWFLIAGVILLRVLAGWRGRRSAYGTLAGFTCAFLLLMFYLVRPMLKGA